GPFLIGATAEGGDMDHPVFSASSSLYCSYFCWQASFELDFSLAEFARSGHRSAARTQVAAATDTSSKIRRWPRARAEERNIPKKVHFIGDGPPTVTWFPRGTGEVPRCAAGLLHLRAPANAASIFRPNQVQKKKVGKNLCSLTYTQMTRYRFPKSPASIMAGHR